jgi:hypothetical protein
LLEYCVQVESDIVADMNNDRRGLRVDCPVDQYRPLLLGYVNREVLRSVRRANLGWQDIELYLRLLYRNVLFTVPGERYSRFIRSQLPCFMRKDLCDYTKVIKFKVFTEHFSDHSHISVEFSSATNFFTLPQIRLIRRQHHQSLKLRGQLPRLSRMVLSSRQLIEARWSH